LNWGALPTTPLLTIGARECRETMLLPTAFFSSYPPALPEGPLPPEFAPEELDDEEIAREKELPNELAKSAGKMRSQAGPEYQVGE
jgi:hypothetical protein